MASFARRSTSYDSFMPMQSPQLALSSTSNTSVPDIALPQLPQQSAEADGYGYRQSLSPIAQPSNNLIAYVCTAMQRTRSFACLATLFARHTLAFGRLGVCSNCVL